jgi:hypothetical protein
MIFRNPARLRFLTVSKIPLEDKRLSWKAKGLLLYLLSKPDNWNANSIQLEGESKDGRESVLSGLKELRENGYIELHTPKTGGKEYHISEEPIYGKPESREIPISVKALPNDICIYNEQLNTNEQSPKPPEGAYEDELDLSIPDPRKQIQPVVKKTAPSRSTVLRHRIGLMMGRRQTTRWSKQEERLLEAVTECSDEELETLEWYYSHPFSQEEGFYPRQSVKTLLENFAAEIEKCRAKRNESLSAVDEEYEQMVASMVGNGQRKNYRQR